MAKPNRQNAGIPRGGALLSTRNKARAQTANVHPRRNVKETVPTSMVRNRAYGVLLNDLDQERAVNNAGRREDRQGQP